MSKLIVKEDRHSKTTVRYKEGKSGKKMMIHGEEKKHETKEDKSMLEVILRKVRNQTDLAKVDFEARSLFEDSGVYVESSNEEVNRAHYSEKYTRNVLWTANHVHDKWNEGLDEGDKDNVGDIKLKKYPETNIASVKRGLAELEGIRCEQCGKNTYNLSDNFCENNECPGRTQDEYGDMIPSTNMNVERQLVVRKRAKLDRRGVIERVMQENPVPDIVNITKVVKIDGENGHTVWKINRDGVGAVATYELLCAFRGR